MCLNVVDSVFFIFFIFIFSLPTTHGFEALAALDHFYRFREIISTSQESKSMGSEDTKSPFDFLSFIFLLSTSIPPNLSLYVYVSSPLSFLFSFLFVRSVSSSLPPPPLFHPLSYPNSFTHSLLLQLTVCFFTSTPVFLLSMLSLLLKLS